MYCDSCGTPIQEGQKSCYKCGAPVLPELIQPSVKNKVLINLTAADQKLPPFVRKPGTEPEAKPEPAPVQTHDDETSIQPTEQNKVEQQPVVSDATGQIPSITKIQENKYQQPTLQKRTKGNNVLVYIGLSFGIVFLTFSIIFFSGNTSEIGYIDYAFYGFFAWVIYIILSVMGISFFKKNKVGIIVALLGIIICIANSILYFFIVINRSLPFFLYKIENFFGPGI